MGPQVGKRDAIINPWICTEKSSFLAHDHTKTATVSTDHTDAVDPKTKSHAGLVRLLESSEAPSPLWTGIKLHLATCRYCSRKYLTLPGPDES